MTDVYVVTIGDTPTTAAATLELAQAAALTAETRYQRDGEWEHRWDEYSPGQWRLMQRRRGPAGKGRRFSWTTRTVFTVGFVTEEAGR